MVAVAAAVVIILIGIIFRSYLFPGAPEGPMEIAVVGFENMSGEEDRENLAQVIPSLLMTGLGQSNRVRILPWDYLRDLLKQLDIRDVTIIDRELGYKVCQKANIIALVTGSWAKIGDTYITDVKVIDPKTRDIIVSVNARGENATSIPDRQIDKLSRDILEGLGVVDSTYLVDRKPVQEITTKSFKAYQYLVRGQEMFLSNNPDRVSESIRWLEQAVDLDTTFAEAYFELSIKYRYTFQSEKQSKALIKAFRHANQSSQSVRDIINITYAYVIEKNIDKAGKILDHTLKRNPYDKSLWVTKRVINLKRNNWSEMVNSWEKILAFNQSDPVTLNGAVYDCAFTGEKEKAIDYLKKYIFSDPGNLNTMHTAGDVYSILGMFDESLSYYRELKEIDPKTWMHGCPVPNHLY